jgi:hypothetical protein
MLAKALAGADVAPLIALIDDPEYPVDDQRHIPDVGSAGKSHSGFAPSPPDRPGA